MDAASAIVLTVVLIALVAMLCYVAFAKEKKTLHYLFITIIIELIVWNTAVLGGKYVAADPGLSVFVDNFAYFGAAFVPVTMLLLGLAYQKSFKGFSRAYGLLFVFPVITMVVIFTNDFHHLFYLSYTPGVGYVQGPYFVFYALYSYACLFTGMGLLCYTAIKTSGVLSLQALLNVAAALIPTVTNICYTLHVPGFYVYTTPVAFTITVLLYIVSLFRFGFLKTVPIATQTVINRISDCFVVIDRELRMLDCNESFTRQFYDRSSAQKKAKLDDLLIGMGLSADQVVSVRWNTAVAFESGRLQTADLAVETGEGPLFYTVEYTPLSESLSYPALVLLFKNVTQHVLDLQALRDNQDILLERERLASLGQMIGGIAHNLKSPILAISGGIDQVQWLVSEYRDSVGDQEVTDDDHREIARDMDEWLAKMKIQLSYMSDIISTVKGQAAQFSEDSSHPFTVGEVLKRTQILMQHSLVKGGCTLETEVNVNREQVVFGDVNSLVQILDNVIDNAIHAYNGDGGTIKLNVEPVEDGVRFSVSDQGAGIAPDVQKLLFKEMTTTRGKHGTGLGLYMSYSTVKGMFRGSMWFETQPGVGTTFFIQIPLAGKRG